MLVKRLKHALFITAFALASALPGGALAQKIKLGYWTSGVSVSFGSVLEEMKFLEKEGLDVEYIKFSDVNGPTRAIVTQSIDVAFGASAAGAFNIAADGVPIKIILATQIAAVDFVVLEKSPIKSLAEFKGKKVGMSPPGSATHALAVAVLQGNHGLKPGDYEVVGGNEPRLAAFLAQGDVAATALRSTTIAQVRDQTKMRTIGNYVDEWRKLTGGAAAPVIGIGIMHTAYLTGNPEAAAKFVAGMIKATEWGAKNTDKVAEILQKRANLKPDQAKAVAGEWSRIYVASMEPRDLTMMRAMVDVFRKSGSVKKDVPDGAFDPEPFKKAKAMMGR
jgi:NitT/TauT family transport system substrate-binding protein